MLRFKLENIRSMYIEEGSNQAYLHRDATIVNPPPSRRKSMKTWLYIYNSLYREDQL